MATVEIFERASGDVIETQNNVDEDAFLVYWTMQCDDEDFGFRFVRNED